MEAKRTRSPERAVDSVRHVDDRPSQVLEDQAWQVERRDERVVFPDQNVVVIDEGIVEGIQIDNPGDEGHRGTGEARKSRRRIHDSGTFFGILAPDLEAWLASARPRTTMKRVGNHVTQGRKPGPNTGAWYIL